MDPVWRPEKVSLVSKQRLHFQVNARSTERAPGIAQRHSGYRYSIPVCTDGHVRTVGHCIGNKPLYVHEFAQRLPGSAVIVADEDLSAKRSGHCDFVVSPFPKNTVNLIHGVTATRVGRLLRVSRPRGHDNEDENEEEAHCQEVSSPEDTLPHGSQQ